MAMLREANYTGEEIGIYATTNFRSSPCFGGGCLPLAPPKEGE